MSITFAIDNVVPCREPLATAPLSEALRPILGENVRIEGAGARSSKVHPMPHGLLGTLRLAYDQHYPVVLSPDDVWLQILHGYALYLQQATAGRERTELVVRDDTFVMGADNPWPRVFTAFSEQIRTHIGAAHHDRLVPGFSTTGPLERAAAEVVVMSAMRNLFRYRFDTLCGIPSVTLLGTVDDWEWLHANAQQLCDAEGLEFWRPALDHCLGRFVDAARGRPDSLAWRSFFKHVDEGSGHPRLTGWVLGLIPFVRSTYDDTIRPVEWGDLDACGRGFTLEALPAPMADAPVLWNYHFAEYALRFCAGFVGVETDADGRIRPCQGWAVVHEDDLPAPLEDA